MHLSSTTRALFKFLFISLLLLSLTPSFAQKGVSKWLNEVRKGRLFDTENLFQNGTPYRRNAAVLEEGTLLTLNRGNINRLRNNPRPTMLLVLPRVGGAPLKLELARVEVTTMDFALGTLGTNPEEDIAYTGGVHYRGIVQGDDNSVVSISLYDDELMGLISTKEGNFVLGKLGDGSNDHLLYNDRDLRVKSKFTCRTPDGVLPKGSGRAAAGIACKTISVYFECDYKLYQDKGSNVTNVTNYVTGLFNQVATLYQNENIDIQISQINVYTSLDPFASLTDAGAVLDAFQAARGTTFTGTLAHFLSTRNLGGGVAYLGVLCNKSFGYGVSEIDNTYQVLPTYSWSVGVIAHELGHNFGSNHTQWCGWSLPTGGTGALDNCYTTEGGCPRGPAPTNGGTVMSYCHLTSTGINLALGFGQLPGNAMRQSVVNASCVASNATAAAPTGLTTTGVGSTTAVLNWLASPNSALYTVEYKQSTSTNWTNSLSTAGTTLTISGLTNGSTYDWRVKNDCSGFSGSVAFTTDGAFSCPTATALAVSNISSSAATVSWASVAGASTYTVQYKAAAASVWITTQAFTGTLLVISGLQAGTTYNWQVRANCSGYSAIANFTTGASSCASPTGLITNNVTTTSARLNWNASAGAVNFTVQYKLSSARKWTAAGTTTAAFYNLTGLARSTTYQWQVKANCSNKYSASTQFTTPAAMIAAAQQTTAGFTVYPNPASDAVNVQLAQPEDAGGSASYRIYDLNGKLKLTHKLGDPTEQIDVSALPTGVYLIRMTNRLGRSTSQKFVKE